MCRPNPCAELNVNVNFAIMTLNAKADAVIDERYIGIFNEMLSNIQEGFGGENPSDEVAKNLQNTQMKLDTLTLKIIRRNNEMNLTNSISSVHLTGISLRKEEQLQSVIKPGGVRQAGNTCYLASVLQQIANIDSLSRLFDSGSHTLTQFHLETTEQFKQRVVLQNLTSDIIESIKMGGEVDSKKINHYRFQMGLCGFPFEHGSYSQEDGAKAFQWLLDQASHSDGSDGIVYLQSTVKVDSSRVLVLGNNSSNIAAQVQKDPAESFLSLEISSNKIRSLPAALESFFTDEALEDGFQFDGRAHKLPAKKQLALQKFPDLLPVQLKRFSNSGAFSRKIRKKVEMPEELTLSRVYLPEGSTETEDGKYELVGIVLHIGTLRSGHYISYVKFKGEWVCADDSKVEAESGRPTYRFRTSKDYGYLYYYQRVRTDDPMGISESKSNK
ncbi:MAG: ubiquitin C-terminal hydrolase [Chlamydiales bacterium]|jgi:ubiquitin C-terminal hydrolase